MSNSKKWSAESAAAPPLKKHKKRKTRAEQEDETIDIALGINTLFSRMDSQLLADYLAQKTSRFGTELSPIELSDLSVPAGHIKDTTSWQVDRTLDNLPSFLAAFSDKPESLKTVTKKKGSPHTLVVAGAGLRAANIVRALRTFSSPENAVSKLFAKHIKVDEQVAFLSNRRTGIGVGTPARLLELMDKGALSLDKLQRLVVDASYIDQKKRGIMDMKDTVIPLARLLTRHDFKDRYGDGRKPLVLMFY